MKQMSKMSHGFPSRKKQGGFIQNLIIPGLLLLGAVIAVIALASNSSSSTDASKEQASLYAAAILSQGVTMKEASQRALADGITTTNLVADTTLLVSNSYIAGTMPTPPKGAELTGQTPAWTFSNLVVLKDSQGTPVDHGTAAADEVLVLDKLNKNVCIRINNKLYNESVLKSGSAGTTVNDVGTAATGTAITGPVVTDANRQAGVAEGCVPGVTGYTYYKLVTPR